MKTNKKGELTTQQIVLLIILILSFAIILYFLFQLNLGKESEKEICHNSVVLRGNTGLAKEGFNLNCKREYVCITKDGSCEQMTSPTLEKVKSVDEVYEVLANEMADCWWMFGEGKVDYVGKDFFKKDNYCSICSQVAFDDSLKEEIGNEISKDEFYKYLSETNISQDQTYAEYLFKTNDISELKRQSSEDESATFGTIELDKQYFNVMGITSELKGTFWKGVIGAAVGIGIVVFTPFTVPVGITVGALVFSASEAGEYFPPEILAITVEGDGVDNEFMAPTIVEADSDKFKALNCYDIKTLA
jgi:hypothetical protein